jgi:hypothetical protein
LTTNSTEETLPIIMVTFRMFVVQDDAIDQVRFANSSLEGSKVYARPLLAVLASLSSPTTALEQQDGVAEMDL